MRTVAVLLFVLTLSAPAGSSDWIYEIAGAQRLEGLRGDPAVGDFTGDGLPDIAGGDWPSTSLQLFVNQGDGTFESRPLPGFEDPARQFQAGDMNGDGLADLVFTARRSSYEYSIAIYASDGAGGFAPSWRPVGGEALFPLWDLDGDGDLDVLVQGEYGLEVLLNDGGGGLTPIELQLINVLADRSKLGDLDEDGRVDLVTWDRLDLVRRLGVGEGRFGESEVVVDLVDSLFALADLDGDGHLDVATVRRDQESPMVRSHLVVARGRGDGTFEDPEGPGLPFANAQPVNALWSGDLDDDGDTDLIGSGFGGSSSVLLNDGSGNFTYGWELITRDDGRTRELSHAVAADFLGDGRTDLFALLWGDTGQILVRAEGAPPRVTDVTPSELPEGTEATITIRGSDFHPDAVLAEGFGWGVETVTWVDPTRIEATVVTPTVGLDPPHGIYVPVTVENPSGAGFQFTPGVRVYAASPETLEIRKCRIRQYPDRRREHRNQFRASGRLDPAMLDTLLETLVGPTNPLVEVSFGNPDFASESWIRATRSNSREWKVSRNGNRIRYRSPGHCRLRFDRTSKHARFWIWHRAGAYALTDELYIKIAAGEIEFYGETPLREPRPGRFRR